MQDFVNPVSEMPSQRVSENSISRCVHQPKCVGDATYSKQINRPSKTGFLVQELDHLKNIHRKSGILLISKHLSQLSNSVLLLLCESPSAVASFAICHSHPLLLLLSAPPTLHVGVVDRFRPLYSILQSEPAPDDGFQHLSSLILCTKQPTPTINHGPFPVQSCLYSIY